MVGIIAAMSEEMEAIKQYMENIKVEKEFENEFFVGKIGKTECVLTTCGIGKVNAARSTQLLICRYNPECIINVGVAGGIDNNIKIGDIVIGERFVQYDFDLTAFGRELGELPGDIGKYIYSDSKLLEKAENILINNSEQKAIVGTIASGDKFVTETEKSKEIYKSFDSSCVDMEGAAIAQVCFIDKVPFIAIRSISDSVNDMNKIDYEKFMPEAARKASDFVKEFLS